MMRNYITLVFCLFAGLVMADEPKQVSHNNVPLPTGVKSDPEIDNLMWHRRSTSNFVILSLEDSQGRFLEVNIENMKSWVYTRWGLPDIDFPQRAHLQDNEPGCMVVCVPNRDLMKKLFQLEHSYGEVRKDTNGKIQKSVLWIVLDGKPSETIPPALTLVCLKELEENKGIKFDYWALRGMAVLNGTLPQIRGKIANLNSFVSENKQIYFTESLTKMTELEWREKELASRDLFDAQSAVLCLMFRQEFGERNFINYLTTKDISKAFGFSSHKQLDDTYKRYIYNLTKDVVDNRTPSGYLQIGD